MSNDLGGLKIPDEFAEQLKLLATEGGMITRDGYVPPRRLGRLHVSPEFLRERLGLQDTVEIIGVKWADNNFSIELLLAGAELPKVQPEQPAPDVMLIMTQRDADGIRSIYAHWDHAPEKEWLIERRPIPPLPADFKWPPEKKENAA